MVLDLPDSPHMMTNSYGLVIIGCLSGDPNTADRTVPSSLVYKEDTVNVIIGRVEKVNQLDVLSPNFLI